MSLSNIKVPLYDSKGEIKDKELIVNEFAGRICLVIKNEENVVGVELYLEDLLKAWDAVKKF